MYRVQQGDELAFRELMNRHLHGLHAYAYRMCHSIEVAEEITQEAFLRVWTRAKTWRPNKVQFSTWLYQITRNLCIDLFRRQKAQFVEDVDLSQIPDTSTRRDETLIIALQQAVQKLPERQKTAFLLCQVQGWSQIEAADLLETTPDAIESLLSRARKTLRKTLSDRPHERDN